MILRLGVELIDFRAVCEIHRQTALLSSGQKVAQETRGYDEDSVQTYSLRSKEDAVDYRYMPDPNLGILKLDQVSVFLSLCPHTKPR